MWLCCLILLPLWSVVLFGRGLWTPDEPREADISWRMAVQSERAVPTLAGEPFLEKPPLAYWAAAAVENAFPGRDAAMRAPNLLYAVVAMAAVVLLAFEMAGAIAAWFAGLTSASFLLALQVSSWLAADAALMAGVTLALLGFYVGQKSADSRAKLLWYCLMHVGLAWAFLAKGPGGWLVPGLTVLGYLASERRWRELLRWQMWAGFASVLGAVGSWIAAVVRSSDGAHALRILLWSNVIGRAVALSAPDASEYAAGHKNWVGKYLVELPYYLLPWTLLFFAALRRAWLTWRGADRSQWTFALSALLLPLLALSLAITARGIYAAPLMPAAALLIGQWAAHGLAQPDAFDRRMMVATGWLVTALVVVLFAAATVVASADANARELWPLAVPGVVITAATLWLSLRALRRRLWLPGLAAVFAAFVVALLVAAGALFPAIDRWQDLAAIARKVDRDIGSRSLALYAPDETTVATLDRVLAGRRRAAIRARDVTDVETLLRSKDPPLFLVQLSGRGRGPVSDRLSTVGVKIPAAAESRDLLELTTCLPLVVKQVYELPQGRRYALLAP